MYEQGALLRLSSSLQRILSVRSHTLVGPRHYAGDFIMDLNEDLKSVYIYSDLVSARPVGDTMAPLLRIVPMSDKKQEVVHYTFAKPHYIPLSCFQFNTTEILLTTDQGKTISFSSGSTIVTLYFRCSIKATGWCVTPLLWETVEPTRTTTVLKQVMVYLCL